jgi:hypothetical protein
LRRDHTGEDGADSKGEDTSDKDQRIPTTDLVQLGSDQPRTSNRSRNSDEQSDEDLHEGSAQNELYDVVAVCTEGLRTPISLVRRSTA